MIIIDIDSATPSSTRENVSASSSQIYEYDVGKLLESNVDLHKHSREHKHRILTTEPSSDSSLYPRTRPCMSSANQQFQPSWLKQYPWLH